MPFATVASAPDVYRVAYGRNPADVARLRPWSSVTPDKPRCERWDDINEPPLAFRVLYTCATREGAFRETLQAFRPSEAYLATLRNMTFADDAEREATLSSKTFPLSWLLNRVVGSFACGGMSRLVDVTHANSLDELLNIMQRRLDVDDLLGPDVDTCSRPVSNAIWRHRDEYHGITWQSRLGANHRNYAYFETEYDSGQLRADLVLLDGRRIDLDDPAFVRTMKAYHLFLHEDDERLYRALRGRSWDDVLHEILTADRDLATRFVRTDLMMVPVRGSMLEAVMWSTNDGIKAFALRDEFHIMLRGIRIVEGGREVSTINGDLRDLDMVATQLSQILLGNGMWR